MRLRGSIALLSTVVLALSAGAAGNGQARNGQQEDHRKSFEEFRKGILGDYQDFRKRLLEHYADFLEGEWHEYESLKGEVRDKTPKPRTAPTVKKTPAKPTTPSKPTVPAAPSKPAAPEKPATPVAPSTPQTPKTPETPKTPAAPKASEESFNFYGLPVSLPEVEYRVMRRLSSPQDYAAAWRELSSEDVASKVTPALQRKAEEMGLNDYLTYCLVQSYVDGKFPDADASARFSLVHYLLANMGYDARIAATVSGVPLLLLPTEQKIYARNYMMVGSDRYYVFTPDGISLDQVAGEGIRTCALPSDAERGRKFNLRLQGLNIPMKAKPFNFEYGPLHLSGEVNENLMPILYHYPQMPVEDFALSSVSPELRKNLASQVKTQLANLEGDEKVEALLKFMHNVFEYSTDEDFHGFEKPYFLEETLYYTKNDCEDRAIFYTWFLWNSLGRKAQLITFPGHESATVELEKPVDGTSYSFDGTVFYVSDPTFIGSHTGMVMPTYRGLEPKVDYTYGDRR